MKTSNHQMYSREFCLEWIEKNLGSTKGFEYMGEKELCAEYLELKSIVEYHNENMCDS